MASRAISGLIAVIYVVAAYFLGDSYGALIVAGYLMLPLACIWFSEDIDAYKGIMTLVPVSQTTPGCAIAFGGWMLLFLPVVATLIGSFF